MYRFNLLNRAKFVKQFLTLPKTQRKMQEDKELQDIKKKIYPKVQKELLDFHKELIDFDICDSVPSKVLEVCNERFY